MCLLLQWHSIDTGYKLAIVVVTVLTFLRLFVCLSVCPFEDLQFTIVFHATATAYVLFT